MPYGEGRRVLDYRYLQPWLYWFLRSTGISGFNHSKAFPREEKILYSVCPGSQSLQLTQKSVESRNCSTFPGVLGPSQIGPPCLAHGCVPRSEHITGKCSRAEFLFFMTKLTSEACVELFLNYCLAHSCCDLGHPEPSVYKLLFSH